MYDRILIPTDGSEGTRGAVDQAIDLAATYDADLYALNVVDTTVGAAASFSGVVESLHEVGEAALEDVRRQAEAAGVDSIEVSVVQGKPHRAILAYADDHDVDLIVMGTHGRTGLQRYLVGSVTEKVVRLADVPVMTVRIESEPSVADA